MPGLLIAGTPRPRIPHTDRRAAPHGSAAARAPEGARPGLPDRTPRCRAGVYRTRTVSSRLEVTPAAFSNSAT